MLDIGYEYIYIYLRTVMFPEGLLALNAREEGRVSEVALGRGAALVGVDFAAIFGVQPGALGALDAYARVCKVSAHVGVTIILDIGRRVCFGVSEGAMFPEMANVA